MNIVVELSLGDLADIEDGRMRTERGHLIDVRGLGAN
jgi:hypothetical protein